MGVDDLLHPLHGDLESTDEGFHSLPLCVPGADHMVPFGILANSDICSSRMVPKDG